MQQSLAFRDKAYLPKSEIKIGLDDLGFERGFGIFDYCRVRNGKITFLNDHLERLQHSQSVLQFEQPASNPFIREIIEHIQSANQLQDAYFKVMITGRLENQVIQPIVTVFQDMYKPYPESMYADGISLVLEEYDKPFSQYKTTFYLGSFRQQTRMKMNGSEDVLFYYNDSVRECSRCNIFIIKNGLIYTPEKNLLWGVTRKHVLACAKQNTIVIEKDISVKELFLADEIFITSTTRNIMPVVKIEDTLIGNGKVGEITKQLMAQFETYCNAYVE